MVALSSASILLAILQVILLLGFHAYMYFPLLPCVKVRCARFKDLWKSKRSDDDIQRPKQTMRDEALELFPYYHIHQLVPGGSFENADSD